VDANPAACRLFGLPRDELLMRTIGSLRADTTPEEAEEIDREFLQAARMSGEVVIWRSDGEQRNVELRALANVVPNVHLSIMSDVTERRRAERHAARNQARFRNLTRRVVQSQEADRQSIARELHDEIAQTMTAVMLNLQSIRRTTADQTVAARIDESVAVVKESLEHARGLSLELRPAILDDLGLFAALRWYAERQAARAGWQVCFLAEGVVPPSRGDIGTACFRVAQEAMTNVARHAGAREVEIRVSANEDELRLENRDDGVGFDVESAMTSTDRGLGILGMQERVALSGGSLHIQSEQNRGTEVMARFALR
jgi:PAS domain S-box-containing protein